MKVFHTSIYRRLALQKARLENLENSDVFDELADIDYLRKLKHKFFFTSQKLLEKELIPQNLGELITSDLKRVCFIRDVFRVQAGNLGSQLEELQKIHNELSSSSFSFDKSDLEKIKVKLDTIQNVWYEAEPKISRLYYVHDWSTSGNLDTYLNEYYFLEKSEDFLKGTSKFFLSFVISPSRFKDEIERRIIEVNDTLKQWDVAYQVAKSKEPHICLLCEKGDIKPLRAQISNIAQYKDVALEEKRQLYIFDRLLNVKNEIQKSVVYLTEISKKDLSAHKHKKYQGLERKSKVLLKESQFLNQSLQKLLGADGAVGSYNKLVAKLDFKIRRKKRKFLFTIVTIVSVLLCLFTGYKGLTYLKDKRIEKLLDLEVEKVERHLDKWQLPFYNDLEKEKKQKIIRLLIEESDAFGIEIENYINGHWASEKPSGNYSGLWVVSNYRNTTQSLLRPTRIYYLKNGEKDGLYIQIDYYTKKIIKKWIFKDNNVTSKVIDF